MPKWSPINWYYLLVPASKGKIFGFIFTKELIGNYIGDELQLLIIGTIVASSKWDEMPLGTNGCFLKSGTNRRLGRIATFRIPCMEPYDDSMQRIVWNNTVTCMEIDEKHGYFGFMYRIKWKPHEFGSGKNRLRLRGNLKDLNIEISR